ncbi:MAG: MBL fold metallo-hydrolase [Chloroflexi bacterium]|nr:MBL fold metallo-hydrolase [Chloroflexota bacterium]
MLRERLSDAVYLFQSDTYAQVNAGAVVGPTGILIIDTLALPQETLAMRRFLASNFPDLPVRYVVNTHHHADHAWGNAAFPGAVVVAHQGTRAQMIDQGQALFAQAQARYPEWRRWRLVFPHVTLNAGMLRLKLGPRLHVRLFPLPGHTPDGIGVYVEEERILFAGDAFTTIPALMADESNFDALVRSLQQIASMPIEVLIPGHGDIVFRGEVKDVIQANLDYLHCLRKMVRRAARRKYPGDVFVTSSVEDCGLDRVLLGGLAESLHQRNLEALLWLWYQREPARSDEFESEY